jgi:hypothetical protein
LTRGDIDNAVGLHFASAECRGSEGGIMNIMSGFKSSLYEEDFSRWAEENAALLRSGNVGDADLDHIAEELEDMGKSQRRELDSRVRIVLMHLLKLEFSTVRSPRSVRSWEATLRTQRVEMAALLKDNPSLNPKVDDAIAETYGDARDLAAGETGLSVTAFPAACPYNADQVKSRDFLPKR